MGTTIQVLPPQRATDTAGRPEFVWLGPPTPGERAREAAVTLGVCAASVALVAIALIAVMALLVGAMELGTALHQAARPEVVGMPL